MSVLLAGTAVIGFGDTRRARQLSEVCPVCGAAPGANCLFGTWRLGEAMHVFQVTPKPFPIEDAGTHPKDEE